MSVCNQNLIVDYRWLHNTKTEWVTEYRAQNNFSIRVGSSNSSTISNKEAMDISNDILVVGQDTQFQNN
jgi:hypothetical protein